MKISKLFHWLYGVIMLLPIFAIVVTSLVSTFNMSAKQESEIHYRYETNEVNNVNDLIEGNLYHFSIDGGSIDSYLSLDGRSYQFEFININYYNFSLYNFELDDYLGYINNSTGNIKLLIHCFDNGTYFSLYLNDSDDYFSNLECEPLDNWNFTLDGDFIFRGFSNPSIFDYSFITSSTYNIIESVETHNLDTQEVFYRAIDKVQQSPLFNWAYDSFLVAPFAYIVNLFSMPTNSFVVMLLSYWLAISIIWLVFDLVMYVPLLVHRWIDKGIIE